jgi:aspartyl-tRNA synthetase
MLKTHSCGELRSQHIGQTVTLAGWVNRRRDMGGVIFIDLRDRAGKAQVVVDAGRSAEAFAAAEGVRGEYVVQVTGQVGRRPPGQENTTLPTGEIEVLADQVVVLNTAKPTPFPVDRDDAVDETVRLRYRYLDLRRERMQRNLTIRHKAIKFIRDFLDKRGFLEDRDAHSVQKHPRRCARLPGAQPRPSRQVLCPAPKPATAQAAAHGGWL